MCVYIYTYTFSLSIHWLLGTLDNVSSATVKKATTNKGVRVSLFIYTLNISPTVVW
jgi:hypothetical protein